MPKNDTVFIKSLENLKLLKTVSLCCCHLSAQTVFHLMELVVECPIEKLNVSANFLTGTFSKLGETSRVRYPLLKNLNLASGGLNRDDILGLKLMIENDQMPEVDEIDLSANETAEKEGMLEYFRKWCEKIPNRKPCKILHGPQPTCLNQWRI